MNSSREFLITFLLKLTQSLKLHVLKLSNNIDELNRQLVSHMCFAQLDLLKQSWKMVVTFEMLVEGRLRTVRPTIRVQMGNQVAEW